MNKNRIFRDKTMRGLKLNMFYLALSGVIYVSQILLGIRGENIVFVQGRYLQITKNQTENRHI